MNASNYINLGEKVINVINSGKVMPVRTITNGSTYKVTKVSLDKDNFFKLAENNELLSGNTTAFGKDLGNLKDWTLDVVHKIKSKYEIVSMTFREGGREVIKGAFSKTKNSLKYHFAYDNLTLQTGHTNKSGYFLKRRKSNIIPKKFANYLWSLPDRTIQIVSDLNGLFDKPKTKEQVCQEWNIKPYKLKQIQRETLSFIREKIKEGLPAMKETRKNHYTIEDFVRALNYLKESPEYNYMHGKNKFDKPVVIDDSFLEGIKTVRKMLDIVQECHENRAFLK